jgi:hypothetical protein
VLQVAFQELEGMLPPMSFLTSIQGLGIDAEAGIDATEL